MPNQMLPPWLRLQQLAHATRQAFDLRDTFAQDADRFDDFAIEAPHMRVDLSKQHWTAEVRQALFDLAEAADFPRWRDRLLGGEQVNTTEKRSADHAAWRRAAMTRPPASLQQLEMESNGKRVGHDGSPLGYSTAGVVWGEEGSNSQHAFSSGCIRAPRRRPPNSLRCAPRRMTCPGTTVCCSPMRWPRRRH